MKKVRLMFISAALLAGTATMGLQQVSAQEGQITLRVAGFKGGAELGAIPAINKQFMAENPNITVEYEIIPNDPYDSIINTRLQAGEAPDVLFGRARKNMDEWVKAGYVSDLSSEPWVKNLVPSAKATGTSNGKVYEFLTGFVGLGMLYNQDMLDAVKIKAPQTYPEFLAALRKLKAAGKVPLYIGSKDDWGTLVFSAQLAANLVYRNNPDFDSALVANKAKFDGPEFRSVLNTLVSLGKGGYYDVNLNRGITGFEQGLSEFTAGRVAFVPHGSWTISGIKKANPSLRFGFTALAAGPKGSKPYGIDLAGVALMVNKKSKLEAAAKKYIAFWAQDRILKQYLGPEGAFTTLKGGTSPVPSEMTGFADAVSEGRTSTFPFQNWPRPDFQAVYMKGLSNLINTNTSVSSVLKTWDTEFVKK